MPVAAVKNTENTLKYVSLTKFGTKFSANKDTKKEKLISKKQST